MPNPAVAQGNAYMETNGGNTRYNAMQIELRRRMSQGLLVQGSYSYAFGRKTWRWDSLRDDTWHYVPSTGSPDHAFKLNWVYELPFGQGKKWGSGAGGFMNALIGGWEWDGVARVQTGDKFNYGGYRLVGMSDDDFQDIFKFYHETGADGKERIYMLPQDVIQNSILAIYTTSPTSVTGYAGALPTGRYLAPASGPDCVQYLAGMCPGTSETRIVTGPMYWKVDMSFVKRFQLPTADGRRGAHGPLQRVRHHQLHGQRSHIVDSGSDGAHNRHGQQRDGVAGHVGRDGRERVAGSGRPHHLVRSAVHLVRA